MRFLSLKTSLIICCLAVVAITLLFIGGYYIYNQKQIIYKSEEKKLDKAISFTLKLIDQKIQQYKKNIVMINSIPIDPADKNNTATEDFAKKFLSTYKSFSGLAFYSKQGRLLFKAGTIDGINIDNIKQAEYLLPDDVICVPLSNKLEHYMLVCRNHKKRITIAALKNSFFTSATKQCNFGDSGVVFIADQNNKIIFHPKNSMLLKTIKAKIDNNKLSSNKIFTYYDPLEKCKMIGLCRPINTSEVCNINLRIMAVQKYSEAFSQLEKTQKQQIAALGFGLLLSTSIIFLISRKLTKPIHVVTNMGKDIINGKSLDSAPQHCMFSELEYLRKVLEHVHAEYQRMHSFRNNFRKEIILRNKFEKKLLHDKTAAEDASKAKDDFIANVSHEIRTPLNAVIGFSEKAMLNTQDATMLSDLKTINNEAEHLLLLINDLLDNAKIEAGKLDLEYMPFDLYQHLNVIAEPFKEQAKNKNLKFELNICDSVPQYIILDSLRLRQVLSNLLSNAIKFTHSGRITLKVETQEKDENYATTRFMVIDSGIGIPKEKQSAIFDKFTQADGSTTRQYGGTGLGTTISKKLVSLMGGRMGVRSVVGQGSTFWFDLVLDINIPPEQLSTLKVESVEFKNYFQNNFMGNILVAEDYNINQILIRSQLEYLGLSVEIADNGKVAVNECQNMLYDLILMDLQMPQMSGVEATRYIRMELPEYKDVPILALTANADKDVRNICRSVGIDDVLSKPTHIDDIAAALYKWCPQLVKNSQNMEMMSSHRLEPKVTPKPNTETSISFSKEVAEEFEPLPQTLNISEGINLFGGNKMVFDMSINAFRDSVTSQLLPELKQNIATKHLAKAGRIAHKIKGGAASIAASELSEVAGKLEAAAKENNEKSSEKLLAILEEKFKELTIFISNL